MIAAISKWIAATFHRLMLGLPYRKGQDSKARNMKEHSPTARAGRWVAEAEELGKRGSGMGGMTEDAQKDGQDAQGRRAVRLLLVERAEAAGMVRRKGVSAEAHAALLDRLCDHLSYMTPENLRTLAELVIEAGNGPARSWWPAEVTVRGLAHGLQARPITQHRIVTSWLASVEGPVAEAGGWLVELYRFLLRHRRPPMTMDQRQMREEAAENNRRMGLVQDRIERNAATDEDRGWLERYLRDQALAREIVDRGRQGRDKPAEGAAA